MLCSDNTYFPFVPFCKSSCLQYSNILISNNAPRIVYRNMSLDALGRSSHVYHSQVSHIAPTCMVKTQHYMHIMRSLPTMCQIIIMIRVLDHVVEEVIYIQ